MSRILIIDDAMFMRHMIRSALEPLGFEIVGEAVNGAQGIDMFRALKPDVTTLDIIMPEMDGLEALRNIRQEAPLANIIMVTAVDQRESMLQAMRLGVSDFIVKPFDDDRVISAVQKAINRAS
jgi:two-component system chemotaxis response regulator CheY